MIIDANVLAILVHGTQKYYDEVGLFCRELEKQHTELGINKIEAHRFTRDLDDGESEELGAEKRKRLLLKVSNAIYYKVVSSNYIATKTYIKDLWDFLMMYEGNEEMLATKGIYKRKPHQVYIPKLEENLKKTKE